MDEVPVYDEAVTISARSTTRQAARPDCGAVSARVRGGYPRRIADVTLAGRATVVDLLVRRFLCPQRDCARRTFVKQKVDLPEPFARRTPGLRRTLERIALALARRPGARLCSPALRARRQRGRRSADRNRKPRSGRAQPYLAYLHQRWNEGCTDAALLYAAIRERGY
ncbi:transposase family protein [Streptomyces sp. NPDC048606]|uniref:transposase family protein n=1 Tax=Streptomyces sp. NPDC048606 TaxID=3154726 RepID=UPI003441D00B